MAKNIFEIVERIKKIKSFKTDSEVASALKMSLGALSNHKTRRSIPYDSLSTFCDKEGISLDWLLTGDGEMLKETQPKDPIVNEIVSLLSGMDSSYKRKILKDVAGEKCLQDFEQKMGDSKEELKSSSFKPLPEKKKTA